MLAQIRARLACAALALALFATSTGAQQPSAFTAGAQNAPLTQAVPVDPRITTATLPNGLRLVREVHAGSSYLSSEDPRVHFGLGNVRRLQALEVRLPDGRIVRRTNVAADRVVDLG